MSPAFYRLCRVWHGYLSAAAFVWLLFFSVTGIFLNHPAWLREGRPATTSRTFQLEPSELAAVVGQAEPGPAVVETMRGKLGLKGQIDSSDVAGQMLFVRLRGASGASELQLDLHTGQGNATTQTFAVTTLFKELHRGERAGPVWRAMIDVTGALLVITSMMGLMIYLGLRFRLRTALFLVLGGLAVMAAGIVLLVN